MVLEVHGSSGARWVAPEEQEQGKTSIFKGYANRYLQIFLPDDTCGCSLPPCSVQRPPDCTHLVFKDDFDEYQQQLREEDHQKDPEELKGEREGLSPAPSQAVSSVSGYLQQRRPGNPELL